MRTFEVMNQTNERIDRRTDNLEDHQRIDDRRASESRTEHIMGNEEGSGCCGHCFEVVCLKFHLPPYEERSCRLARFQEGQHLEPELALLWPLHP